MARATKQKLKHLYIPIFDGNSLATYASAISIKVPGKMYEILLVLHRYDVFNV
jgi:hypothetical protein